MARTKGRPQFKNKRERTSFVTTKEAALKLNAASRRSGRNSSDLLTYFIMLCADNVTEKTFPPVTRRRRPDVPQEATAG